MARPIRLPLVEMMFAASEATECWTWTSLLSALLALLPRVIACDAVVWNGVDPEHGRVMIYASDEESSESDDHTLLLELDDHPVKNHYLSRVDPSGGPIRLTDVISDRDFRATRTWAELFAPRGVSRQLTVPTRFNETVTAATAWAFNRRGDEFTNEDLRVAREMQPLLSVVESSAWWRPDPLDAARLGSWSAWARRPESGADRHRQMLPARPGSPLTRRELEVLSLVAEGMTATSVGFRLRISAATVRKHLEHIYDKTGCRDRLTAVTYARRAGLLRDD